MRRIVCFVLAIMFASQCSGATALANSAQNGRQSSFLVQLQVDLEQIIASATTTQIGALLAGNADRWNAMHAPAPKRPTIEKSDPSKTIQHNLIRPTSVGPGMRGTPPAMLQRPLLPKDAEKLRTPAVGSSSMHAATSNVRARIIDLSTRTPVPARGASRSARIRPMDVTTGSANPTGINPWWTYEESALPGVGKYMVNVANGNAIVQADDVDVPERGIDLAFQRTYNSLSKNDWNAGGGNDDGSPNPNVYGAGWTNTFDAHLAVNSAGGISVFDIDGARYDYTPNGSGCLTPPAGMHNTLCSDGGFGDFWTKKNGTVYYFYRPDLGTLYIPADAGYAGRLAMIYGRNQNNYIWMIYYWQNGDSSSTANLTQIVAAHADGHALHLAFGTLNGKLLLSSVTRPDGQQVTYSYNNPYSYNANGGLEEVDLPGNNQGTIRHEYGYYGDTNQLNWVSSPRWTAASGGDGSYTWFNYDGSHRVSGVQLYGLANPVPNDGTGTAIQPNYPAWQTIAYTAFSYPSTSQTNLTDVDGHATTWDYDSSGRATQTEEWTGSLWLVTNASWDSNNNLTESVDARGYAADYAYDSNGNTIAMALPSVSTSQGTFRPTSFYSYDRTNNANNVVEYCDAVETHALGQDWTGNPGASDSLCPNQSGATRYVWDYSDGAEPFGRLSNSYLPLGYHRSYSYSTGAQGGDYGLPSDVSGDSMTQSDGTARSPHQSLAYDGYGNLTTYSTGVGSSTLSYDSLNRPSAVTDPDSVTSRTCYYANGQVQAKQSASQFALDGNVICGSHSVSYAYDPDGNAASETHHFGNQAGTTTKFYDGADRLVEVAQPHDPNADLYSYAWLTRYLYDLSQGNTVSVDGATFHAYGNLFKTQEYLPSNPVIAVNTTPAGPAWLDVRGTAFDALDRATAAYENAFGTTPKLSNTYDSSGNYGLLSQSQNAVGQQTILSYLPTGWTYQKTYQNDGGVTPSETYTYDSDGRANAIQSSQFGSENLAYDSDGRVTSDAEPTGGGYTNPVTMTYGYYGDGLRQSLSFSSSALTVSNTFQYSYRTDGLLQTQHLTYPITGDFAWTYTSAGRELTQSDPYTGSVITLYTLMDNPTSSTRTMEAKTITYDSYGQVASLVLPEGYAYGSFTYDAEGETTGYTRSNAYCPRNAIAWSCSGGSRTQTYSIRGELVSVGDPNQYARSGGLSANGTLVTSNGAGGSVDSFDARNGMILSKNLDNNSTPYSYDSAGRQTQVTNTWPYGYTAYATRTYDAGNHIISQAYTGTSFSCNMYLEMCGSIPNGDTSTVSSGSTLTYAWGPNGHPIEMSGPQFQGSASIHWDGDDILMAGDFEVGKLGTANNAGEQYAQSFTVTDRDMTGQAVSSHTWQDFGSWDSAPPAKQCGPCAKGQADGFTLPSSTASDNDMYTPPTSYLSGVREDGYSDGYGNTFQGVRAYDGNLGTWTSPDAYAGDVHDPMSQKPYIWNRNNPLEYMDPSGYDAWGPCSLGGEACGLPHPSPNADIYVKVEGHAGPVSVSITITGKSGSFVSVGGIGSKTALRSAVTAVTKGKVTPGASIMFGSIQPNEGRTSGDVVSGLSGGLSGGDVVGAEAWGNRNGSALGFGLTTAGLNPISGNFGQAVPGTKPTKPVHAHSHGKR